MAKKESLSENVRFRSLIKEYRIHFSLTQSDVADLLKLKQSEYSSIETGKKFVDFDIADNISKLYGLRHYQLMKPGNSLPSFDSLPETTKQKIIWRQENGILRRDYSRDIAGILDKIINETDILKNPMTAEEIRLAFPEEIRGTFDAIRITDLLKKAGRDKIVEQVGKRGKANLYQLKET